MYSEPRSLSTWAVFATGLLLASLFFHTVRRPGQPPALPMPTPTPAQAPLTPPLTSTAKPSESPPSPAPTTPVPVPVPVPVPASPPTATATDHKVPPPREVKPVVTVASTTEDLENRGEVRVRFTLDKPAPKGFTIGYELVSRTFAVDRLMAVAPEPVGSLAIDQGQRAAELILKKRPAEPAARPASHSRKAGNLILALAREDGFAYAAKTRRTWEFPCTTTEFGPAYRLTLVPVPGFREEDPRRGESISVEFELDRAPTDHRIPIRFQLAGDALASDFEFVDRPPEDLLWFRPGERRAGVVLRRRPGPRGLGDRALRIVCDPTPSGEVSLADGQTTASIRIPDPRPRLSWSIDRPGPGARDPSRPASARVRITARPPSSRRIVFRYQVVGPHRQDGPRPLLERTVVFEPPEDPWARDEVTQVDPLEIPTANLAIASDGAAASGIKVQLIPVGEAAVEPPRQEFVVPVVSRQPLTGQVLVILVLTKSLSPDDEPTWRTLRTTLEEAERNGVRNRLVGRSIFVLDAHGELRRLAFEAIKDFERFPRDARLGSILGPSSKAVVQNLIDRLKPEDRISLKKVLLVRDLPDRESDSVIKAFNDGLLGTNWWVYWIDPDAGRSPLAGDVEMKKIREEATLMEFAIPGPKLAETLLSVLADGG